MIDMMAELQSQGKIVITSFNERRTIFTDDILAEINQNIESQKSLNIPH